MSVTDEARTTTGRGRARSSQAPADGGAGLVVSPPKLRRRPLVAVASALAVAVGALVSAYAYTSTSNADEVLAVTSTVHRGEVIDRTDVTAVRVGVDPALRTVGADQLDRVVGQRAATDLPAGGLVTDEAIAAAVVPGRDLSVVGVGLPPALLPGEPLRAGDRVRVVATPGDQGEVTAKEPRTIAATVVGVHGSEDTGQLVVDVQVPFDDAAELAARAATGKVALVLDSRER
ncbi:SAF domain-containing protein [Friedmanniella luteola]|uniref:SAF domain-containing protein n=1 Tax=Friedmanniella luteola TaxID=546871 RepID=A0A1H1WYJ2_9ACTN|nr:SAF domain-containing protein [Friedmanniella luteola]